MTCVRTSRPGVLRVSRNLRHFVFYRRNSVSRSRSLVVDARFLRSSPICARSHSPHLRMTKSLFQFTRCFSHCHAILRALASFWLPMVGPRSQSVRRAEDSPQRAAAPHERYRFHLRLCLKRIAWVLADLPASKCSNVTPCWGALLSVWRRVGHHHEEKPNLSS